MKLPVDAILSDLIGALASHSSVVVSAPPGTGKTTRIPPALMRAFGAGRILVSQPRRIAARSTAARMAIEDGSTLGTTIGFKTRFESRVSKESRIVVMTEGLLTRTIQSDPFLTGVCCVVLDEFHERSVDLDLALAFLKEIMSDARPDLKLVIMSATLEVEPLVAYLDAAVLEAEAPMFPITMKHDSRQDDRPLFERMSAAISESLQFESGDLLAFLPGIWAIRKTREALVRQGLEADVDILELHGDLDARAQDAAIAPSARRKVILSTNVAESSITIPKVRVVVDSGVAKVMRHDQNLGLDRLEEERISMASARQRSGRAGRTGPGLARRLWTGATERQMAEQSEPELQRLDLSSAILQVLEWGSVSVAEFDWFERPEAEAIARAVELLVLLGAIKSVGETQTLTPLGQSLCRLPLHPRLGVLLRQTESRGIPKSGALACALLGERDVLNLDNRRDLGSRVASQSDLQLRIDLIENHDRAISKAARRRIDRIRRQLEKLSQPAARGQASEPEEALRRCILAAFPDRVARRRSHDPKRALMVGGRGLTLLDEVAVDDGELFCAVRLSAGWRKRGGDSPVAWVSALDEAWLADQFPDWLTSCDVGEFDSRLERVVGVRRRTFCDLVLEEKSVNLTDRALAGEILAKAVVDYPERALKVVLDEVTTNLIRRCEFMGAHDQILPWPAFPPERLIELISSLCPGRYRFEDLRRAGLRELVEAELGFEKMRVLDREAPEEFRLPNGTRLRVVYEGAAQPKLSSKLQDFFGQVETPLFANGQVQARIELLAPNRRPVQITSDLANFWRETYQRVRKDLRGRYPKHDWPENPPS